MSEALAAFHFLRPWWLLALLPAAVLAHACLRGKAAAGAWVRVMDPELLSALLLPRAQRHGALPFWLLLSGWSLAAIGLAGPAWERLPEPVHRRGDALVVALDLSSSMLAADLSPTRLARARFKLSDLLAERRDAYTALVAYAGDAHVVTPLSDDIGTVAAMLPALDPGIMPVPGNDPVAALRLATELLRGAGMNTGRVLLMTDSLDAREARAMVPLLEESGISLAVLGVGTREGAPVPLAGGGFARDGSGGIAIPRMDVEGMRKAATVAGAQFHEISVDDTDLSALLPDTPAQRAGPRDAGKRVYDQWRDLAPWIALCLLPLAALGMRRGWLLLLPLCLWLPTPQAHAFEWQDLWLRKDQQGAAALASGDAARAAQLFRDPAWKGSAQFEAGDWAGAAASFAQAEGADADYNRGNALARDGRLQDALAAYDAALSRAPDMEDARTNRALVEELLRQQQAADGGQSADSGAGKDGEQQQGSPSEKDADGQQPSGARPEQPAPGSDGSGTQDGQSSSPDAATEDEGDTTGRGSAPSPPPPAASGADGSGDTGEREQSAAGTGKADTEGVETGDRTVVGETEGQSGEETQAVEQWLRQVPDDPGALLRRKFEYEAGLRRRGEEQ